MNEIVNKFLLAEDKFMSAIQLRQSGFTQACGPYTEKKERIQKLKETGDSRYIFQNELDKASFQHDMAYEDPKDLTRRIASDKKCVIKHLILPKIQNMMDINVELLHWLIKFLIQKTSGSGIKNENMSDQQLAEESHK